MSRISEAVALLQSLGAPDKAQLKWWRENVKCSPVVTVEIEAMVDPSKFTALGRTGCGLATGTKRQG